MTVQNDWRSLVPPTKHKAVEKALQGLFATVAIQDAALLTGGASTAMVIKLVVDDRPYVMRLLLNINELNDPARQFLCLHQAAEAGISPRVLYSDVADAITITDYVAPQPWQDDSPSRLVTLAEMVKAIHNVPLFPPLVNYLDGIDGFIQTVRGSGMLPELATQQHFLFYAIIQSVYPRHDTDLVSSHNDLNPRNILFDGNRIWVIDWDTAFRNDRYADLAGIANFFIQNDSEAEEETLLRAYFCDTLDDYKRARFFLMRQVNHMFYAMALMLSAAALRPEIGQWDTSMETPRLQDFHRLFANAATDPLASPEGMFLYGKVRLNEALYHMKSPRFAEAVRNVQG